MSGTPAARRPAHQVGDVGVVADVEVPVGDHGAAAVPAPAADDVHLGHVERVRRPDDRADVEVVRPVLDGHVEGMPPRVQVGHDRLDRPVPVAVQHVAPVAVLQQLGVVARVVRPGTFPRTHAGRAVGHGVSRAASKAVTTSGEPSTCSPSTRPSDSRAARFQSRANRPLAGPESVAATAEPPAARVDLAVQGQRPLGRRSRSPRCAASPAATVAVRTWPRAASSRSAPRRRRPRSSPGRAAGARHRAARRPPARRRARAW